MATYKTADNRSMSTCLHCGMRGDLDPFFHEERYGHWPVLRGEGGGVTHEPLVFVADDAVGGAVECADPVARQPRPDRELARRRAGPRRQRRPAVRSARRAAQGRRQALLPRRPGHQEEQSGPPGLIVPGCARPRPGPGDRRERLTPPPNPDHQEQT
jgi:hypothetical protein